MTRTDRLLLVTLLDVVPEQLLGSVVDGRDGALEVEPLGLGGAGGTLDGTSALNTRLQDETAGLLPQALLSLLLVGEIIKKLNKDLFQMKV